MRAVLTRVKSASVTVDGKVIGRIGPGFLILLGITHEDTEAQAVKLADKLMGLRIFEDENEKMNRSLEDVGGQVLVYPSSPCTATVKRGAGRSSWLPPGPSWPCLSMKSSLPSAGTRAFMWRPASLGLPWRWSLLTTAP